MAQSFEASNAPFDRLIPQEIETVRAALDLGYFHPGETIIARGAAADSLFIVYKGCIEERDGEELVALRGPGDFFDSRAVVHGTASNAFVAREETLCHLLPRELTLRLIGQNPRFGAFFYLDISRKLDAVARDREEARLGPAMRARVSDLFLHPAEFVDATASIEELGRRMNKIGVNALFVRDGEKVGIVTGMNLAKAAVLNRLPIATPVASATHFNVISVSPDDFVSMAILKMAKHNKRRLAVVENGAFIGVLEDIDLVSFLAGNSQLVAARIDRANARSELISAAREITSQVRMLRRQGVKIDVICEIISDLNSRLFAKLFEMTASEAIREAGCLIVMGSEGRGEQTVRTDQDNGLILSAPVPEDELRAFRESFSKAAEALGFPPCPGNVMVSNPLWSKTLHDYRADFRRWLARPDEAACMNVAIFYDACAVAGQDGLLQQAKTALVEAIHGERLFLTHFARATDAFPTPIGLFKHLITSKEQGDALDLKKGGVFPIVHGVRALAIEQGLFETNTKRRIGRLDDVGALKHGFARDLTEALDFLMTLRLDHQIDETAPGGLVRPRELSSMERDLLRDAFQVVKQFRELIRHHFNLTIF
jgi:CBS domain-containing protein